MSKGTHAQLKELAAAKQNARNVQLAQMNQKIDQRNQALQMLDSQYSNRPPPSTGHKPYGYQQQAPLPQQYQRGVGGYNGNNVVPVYGANVGGMMQPMKVVPQPVSVVPVVMLPPGASIMQPQIPLMQPQLPQQPMMMVHSQPAPNIKPPTATKYTKFIQFILRNLF